MLSTGRLSAAVLLGFSATLACVTATTQPGEAKSPEVHPLTTPAIPSSDIPAAEPLAGEDAGVGDAGDGGAAQCPYGALEDPHRGFVRCLAKGERSPIATESPDAGDGRGPDAGAAPDAGDAGADGGANAGPPPAPPAPVPGPPPLVEVKAPKFENGEVPTAEKALNHTKLVDAIAKCVADAGGLSGKTGSLKVEFLVRARGKAEGVEVTGSGVPEDGVKCVRALLKNRTMGTPTADPVGVKVVYSLKPAAK